LRRRLPPIEAAQIRERLLSRRLGRCWQPFFAFPDLSHPANRVTLMPGAGRARLSTDWLLHAEPLSALAIPFCFPDRGHWSAKPPSGHPRPGWIALLLWRTIAPVDFAPLPWGRTPGRPLSKQVSQQRSAGNA